MGSIGSGAPSEAPVSIGVDYSNIWYGVREAAPRHGEDARAVRVHAENLRAVLEAARPVAWASLVGCSEVPDAVWRHFRPSFQVALAEVGRQSGSEQGSDEKLQAALYPRLFTAPRGVLVLATGDGAGWRRGIGFIPLVLAARRQGWGVEVIAFRHSLNGKLAELAGAVGVLVDLEPYYEAITFQEDTRWPAPLSLRHRATAEPHPYSTAEERIVRRILGLDEAEEGGAA